MKIKLRSTSLGGSILNLKLDCEEGRAPKNWCFWTVVLEKTLESLLDCKEIQPVHSEGDQPWDFFGRNDAKAETPVLWPPHAKVWLIGKDSDAGRDWGQEEKGMTEDERAGWHHWLDGHESEWTPGVGDGQGGLACCDSWGRKELDTTEQLNWTEVNTFSGIWGIHSQILIRLTVKYFAAVVGFIIQWSSLKAMNSSLAKEFTERKDQELHPNQCLTNLPSVDISSLHSDVLWRS